MRLLKRFSIASGSLLLALSAVATGAQAHDDDYGWKWKKHHPRGRPVYVVQERPVYYYSQPRVVYAPPPMAYYPPSPPSLNIVIPLR